ncbi:tetratricopeptide repeat protein [Nonomuraea muscovyensis]
MMPGDTSDFTGRLDEVTRIGRALAGDGRAGSAVPVVAVVGRAGIGKTALAVHVAHGIGGSFPDGRLFADLHAGADRRPSPAQVLERFLRALGLPGPAIPDGLGERAEVYRTLLAGRRMLVVLDEVHAESQVRPLLPGEPGWLQHGDAGVRAPLSLSPAGLGEDAKRLLRALAVLDSPDCPTWVGAALLDVREPVAQDLFDELADAQLVEVTGLGPFARYRLHDLVRLFARELPAPQDQVTALSRMVASLLYLVEQAAYREFGGGQPHLRGDTPSRPLPGPLTEQLLADPLAWFDSERAAVRSAVRQTGEAGLTSLCWDLARKAASFYKLRAYRDDWRETHETAPAVARRAGGKRGVAAIHVSTAELLLGTDSSGEVRRELDAACALFEEIGHEYGPALAVRDLALLDRLEGRHADAAACGERALELLRRTGTPVDVAYVLMGLAHLKLECGQVDAAATLLEESLALSVGHGARRLRAQILYRKGRALVESGEPDQGLEIYGRSLGIVRSIGDPIGEAHLLHDIGACLLAQDRLKEAEGALGAALEVAEGCGHRRAQEASLPLIFSSKTFQQMGSRASCCRWVFCLSVLTRTRPMSAIEERHPFIKRAARGS